MSAEPLWPLTPNWRDRYTVTYEFKTDIFTSRSGREQRRAQRTTPRKGLQFTVTRTGDDARLFSRFLTKYQGPAIAVADSSRFARVTAAVASTGTTFQVDDAAGSWIDGAEQVVLSFAGSYVAAQIASVNRDAKTVVLTAPTGRDWPLNTKLHPLLRGRLDDQISVKNYHDRTIDAEITFRIEPAAVRADDAGDPDDVFNSREVFTLRPNFLQPVDGNYQRGTDLVDFGRGRTATYLPITFSTRLKQYQLLQAKRADRASVVALFQRMKGRRGEFYMPSYEDDFTPAVEAEEGSLTATFAGSLLDDVYKQDDVHRAVMIVGNDGSRFYRRITASATDGARTTLTTDIGWPCAINATVSVSWLLVHRFATDLLTMECVTDEVGQVQVSVTSLEDLPVQPVDAVFGMQLDGAAQWVLENWGLGFFIQNIADPFDFMINTKYPYLTLSIGEYGVNYAADNLGNAISWYVTSTGRIA